MSLVDAYYVAISPILAGRGPTFMAGLRAERTATLVDVTRLQSGVVIRRYAFARHPAG